MVLSVQFKGTWFLCILGVFFMLFWLLVPFSDPCFFSSEPSPGGSDMTSRGICTVNKRPQLGLTRGILIMKPSST